MRLFCVVIEIFYCFIVGAHASRSRNVSADEIVKILDAKLADYDIKLRPGFGGPPLNVEMEVIVSSVDRISEVNMDFTVTLDLNQFWRDDRLRFSTEEMDLILAGDFAKRIWVPDTCVANDKHAFLHDVTERNTMIKIRNDGYVTYGMRLSMTLSCMMDLHYYPLDDQNCSIEIESYGYPIEDLIMQWKSVSAIHGWDRLHTPQFTLVGVSQVSKIAKTDTGSYQRLSLSFRICRNIGFFVYQTYLPSILIVVLSWISFWINYQATSARVGLGITTVLTMTTISTGVRSSLPRISYVKAIDVYLVMCFVFVFAALLEYAAVNYTYWAARTKQKLEEYRRAKRRKRELQKASKQHTQDLDSPVSDSTTSSSPSSPGRLSPLASLGNKYIATIVASNNKRNVATNTIGSNSTHPAPHIAKPITYTDHAYAGYLVSRHRLLTTVRRQRKIAGRLRLRSKNDKHMEHFYFDHVQKVDQFSRIIFPISFILFNIFYWTFYSLPWKTLLTVKRLHSD